MKIAIRRSFEKDVLKLPGPAKKQIAQLINRMTQAEKITDIPSIKKLTGFRSAYRLRLGQYRIGIILAFDVIELVRILNRKDIYKYFP